MSAGIAYGEIPALRVGNDYAGVIHVVADCLQPGVRRLGEIQCEVDVRRGRDTPSGIRIASALAVTARDGRRAESER